jgi:hypothetical protein
MTARIADPIVRSCEVVTKVSGIIDESADLGLAEL